MSIVRIDEVEYELDHLTEEAKAQLLSLQHTDQKIAEFNATLPLRKRPEPVTPMPCGNFWVMAPMPP